MVDSAATTPEAVLSVIIPMRNVDPYVADMLTSLQNNAEDGIEFLVIDDGSTDETPQILLEFADTLPGMRTVRHDVAVGLADARNAGLDLATGRYVTFLDGDDWLAPGYLAQLVGSIETLGCDFVRVDHVQSTGRARVTHRAPEARRNVVLDPRSGIGPAWRRTMVDYPYAWAGIYRRSLGSLLRFPGGLHTAEDRPWIWRLHREADSYAVAPLAGLFYRRQVANSLTQIGDARQLHFLDAFAMVLAQVVDESDIQPKAVRQFLAVLAHHIRNDHRFTFAARRELRRRAKQILAGLPQDMLLASVPTDGRSLILRPLLPSTTRRRLVA